MNKESCCAFTGHRPHKFPWGYNETDGRCIAVKNALFAQIAALASIGVTDFFTGMADGADCWAALSVLELKQSNSSIRLHCILPHPGQADRWSNAARERYEAIINQADETKLLSLQYYKGCLLNRNQYLVKSAEYLLAVYDGKSRGGTAATIEYARQLHRKIIIIDPIERIIRHAITP